MRRCGSCIACALALASIGSPASAQQGGNGLYEPFPRAEARERAESFLKRLPRASDEVGGPIRAEDLDGGRFLGGGNSAAETSEPGGERGAASARAIGNARASEPG